MIDAVGFAVCLFLYGAVFQLCILAGVVSLSSILFGEVPL